MLFDFITKEKFVEWGWKAGQKVFIAVVIFVIGFFVIKIIDKFLTRLFEKTKFDETVERFFQRIIIGFCWIIVLLILLSALNVNIGPMIASLGIAGFVLGFALKDTLSNLAAGMMILIYKPFVVGNFVKIGGIKGTVREVGISACTLRTFDNKEVIVPNSNVWSSPITNYSAYPTRKIDLTIGISYDSDMDKAIRIISEIFKKEKRILKDPAPQIAVKELADSSINLAVRPWVKREDFWPVKFDITKKIKQEFDKNRISIPYPQMDINLKKK